jgi:hypothetical protein
MSTEVRVLGTEEKKTPIMFILTLGRNGITTALTWPDEYKHIELICRNYKHSMDEKGGVHDLMFAYGDDRNYGSLFLGHFNDGIVEERKINKQSNKI